MPFAIVLIVGLFYYSGVIDKVKKSKPEKTIEAVTPKPMEVKPIVKVIKPIPKQPEQVKEEIKIEPKELETIKEVVKSEIKQIEPVKKIIKEEPKEELIKSVTEEVTVDESESSYLKIILYIIAAIATIFGGFYFFTTRGSNQVSDNKVDIARKDIEETYQPESQEQQPAQEDTQPESQEQQPAQEDTQPKPQERQITEDEDNNK